MPLRLALNLGSWRRLHIGLTLLLLLLLYRNCGRRHSSSLVKAGFLSDGELPLESPQQSAFSNQQESILADCQLLIADSSPFLAGRLGFEPRQSAPKALDLPLVDRPRIPALTKNVSANLCLTEAKNRQAVFSIASWRFCRLLSAT